ncbi:oxidoreductase [Pedobacter sp. HMF7647]|uniref:Oxidoreductase n=1 Tax=Hufsiella arboris TaxID=2695275 RepID=A0A7K1YDA4_9SPHI|nr:oxidoreductase [Hufsiella arboris]
MRGLSILNNQVAWVSGSNGWVASTTDGAKTWHWQQLKGYENIDFRDIEVLSEKQAVIVSAGSPAVILKTGDGGLTWRETYRNNDPEIFLDGMDFYNARQGIIFGDPITSKMQLLTTDDAGDSWKNCTDNLKIKLEDGEAGFAASGTSIRTMKNGKTWIATGGKQSRVFISDNFGKNWKAYNCPIIHGANSTGPFSIAFYDIKTGYVVGGDYRKDTVRTKNSFITYDGGLSWNQPAENTFGYRSAVEYLSKSVLICTGTSGTDISSTGGKTWKNISKTGFNCVRKAKSGNLVLLAGGVGTIARLLNF